MATHYLIASYNKELKTLTNHVILANTLEEAFKAVYRKHTYEVLDAYSVDSIRFADEHIEKCWESFLEEYPEPTFDQFKDFMWPLSVRLSNPMILETKGIISLKTL